MKVINFFGGPGVGKSTLAAGLFHKMKSSGEAVEIVTEYAKDVTWEGRTNLLGDQIYLLAKQNRRLARLLDHPVKYAITDSPLLLCAAYARLNGADALYSSLQPLIVEVFNSYRNINVVIEREPAYYAQVGRSQTLEQAVTVDGVVLQLLYELAVPYVTVRAGEPGLIDELYATITK